MYPDDAALHGVLLQDGFFPKPRSADDQLLNLKQLRNKIARWRNQIETDINHKGPTEREALISRGRTR